MEWVGLHRVFPLNKLHSPYTNRPMELGLYELTVFLLIAVAPTWCVPPGAPCPSPPGINSTCVCQTPRGVVDLRRVASRNGTARYKGFEDPNDYVYEYNPCYTFNTSGDCKNIYLCQKSKDVPPSAYKIADAGTERMFLDNSTGQNVLTVFYTSLGSFKTYREVNVHLECDKDLKDPIVTTSGDNVSIFTYELTFKSCQSCPGEDCGRGKVQEEKMP